MIEQFPLRPTETSQPDYQSTSIEGLSRLSDEELLRGASVELFAATEHLHHSMTGGEVPRKLTHAMDFLVRPVVTNAEAMGAHGFAGLPEKSKNKLTDVAVHMSSVFGFEEVPIGLNSVRDVEYGKSSFKEFIGYMFKAQGKLYSYDYPVNKKIPTTALVGLCQSSLLFLGDLSERQPLGTYERTKILGAVNNLRGLR
ncbi:MAG: hypothetical protein M3Q14_01510 [bacterium]|nr:hypothetical protein [bacterium]